MKNQIHEIANTLQEGERYTLVAYGSFGFVHSNQMTVQRAIVTKYAQHDQVLEIRFKQKGRRKLMQTTFLPNDRFLIWKGWVDVNTDMYVSEEEGSTPGVTVRKSLSSFDIDYMKRALASVDSPPLFKNGLYDEEDLKAQRNEDFEYELVFTDETVHFAYSELIDLFPIHGFHSKGSSRKELQGRPIIMGRTPMYGGETNGVHKIRYEFNIPAPEKQEPIKLKHILITRGEGPSDLCRIPHTALNWAGADAILQHWAPSAPKDGGYDKVDFTATFDDGFEYSGTYDLKYEDLMSADLKGHCVDNLLFGAGLKKPHWMRQEKYDEYTKDRGREEYLEVRRRYFI